MSEKKAKSLRVNHTESSKSSVSQSELHKMVQTAMEEVAPKLICDWGFKCSFLQREVFKKLGGRWARETLLKALSQLEEDEDVE